MEVISDFIIELFTFRNDSHRSWFFLTMGIFLFLSSRAFILQKTKVLGSAAIGFLVTALSAVVVVLLLKMDTEAYSIDCIWYNSLLAFMFFGVKKFIDRRVVA